MSEACTVGFCILIQVWITYEPDLPQDQKDELRQIVESPDCLLASPYPDLPTPVVASAWGKQLQLQSVDEPGLQQFIQAYRKGPQTPEPGASCTGATEMNAPPKDTKSLRAEFPRRRPLGSSANSYEFTLRPPSRASPKVHPRAPSGRSAA